MVRRDDLDEASCPDCAAVAELVPIAPRVLTLVVWHDATCPWMQARRARMDADQVDDVDEEGQLLPNWTGRGAAVVRHGAGWVGSCLYCRQQLVLTPDRDVAIDWASTHADIVHPTERLPFL